MQKKTYIKPSVRIHVMYMEEDCMKNWMSEETSENDAKQLSLDIEDQDSNDFWEGNADPKVDIWGSEE